MKLMALLLLKHILHHFQHFILCFHAVQPSEPRVTIDKNNCVIISLDRLDRRRKWVNIYLLERMISSAPSFGIRFQSALANHTSSTFRVLLESPICKFLQTFCVRNRLLNISVRYVAKTSVPFFESRHLAELLRRQHFWFETKKIWVLTHKCKRFRFVHLSLDQLE